MDYQGKRIAFDTSPFNLLLNGEAKKLGKSYDENGKWAREGQVDFSLLEELNSLPFYRYQTAKSLGREDMERDFIPLLEKSSLSPKDKLATLVEHFAFQIATTIQTFQSHPKPSVLLTGGGAYNQYFVERLDHFLLKKWEQYEASKELIEFKEALIFAFLGTLNLRGEVNCLASVTGACRDSCGGAVYG
jgi:anhydro-N-acetylmuramic acid kinase